MNDDIDLGAIPLEHAHVLLIAVCNALNQGAFWDPDNHMRAVSLKALLMYRIAKAEQMQTWAEPA